MTMSIRRSQTGFGMVDAAKVIRDARPFRPSEKSIDSELHHVAFVDARLSRLLVPCAE